MVRRRRIRRNGYNRYNSSYRDIDGSYTNVPFEEFKFYNIDKTLIDNDKLNEIYDTVMEDGGDVFWTNEEFGNNGIVFRFRQKDVPKLKEDNVPQDPYLTDEEKKVISNEIKRDVYVDIIIQQYKISPEVANNASGLIKGHLFVSFDIDEDTIKLFQAFGPISDIKEAKLFETKEQLVEFLIESKAESGYSIGYSKQTAWEDFKHHTEQLFGAKLDYEIYPEVIEENYQTGDVNIFYIIDVIEKRINSKNYRIALVFKKERYDSQYCTKIFDEDSQSYNYIDKKRVYFMGVNHGTHMPIFLDLSTNKYGLEGQIEISKDTIYHINRDLDQILPPDERLITPLLYRFYYERWGEKQAKFATNKMFEQLKEQYQKLLGEGREIKINNVIIHKNYVKIGDEFSLEFDEDFLDVITNLSNVRGAVNVQNAQFNLNTIYESLLEMSIIGRLNRNYSRADGYKNFAKVEFKVNGMPIEVTKDESRRARINGIFTRIDDIYTILTRGVCYTNVNEYNRFIKDVSYIGIEWKRIINNGVAIELVNPFYGIFRKTGKISLEKIIMRFSFLWDDKKRTQVYLLANGTKYLIRYKGLFKRHLGTPHIVTTMEELKVTLTECLGEFDKDVFLKLVQNAIAEGEIVRKRGDELVALTIKETNAVETTIQVGHNELPGYKIIGYKTNTPYFIHKVSLDVYKWTDGQWNRRCVVDDPNKQRIFQDRLANRLMNIYNEYKGISTIQN